MSRPLTNVAHSGLERPPPRTDAPGLPETRRAHRLAMWYASAGIAPTAVANESITRRFVSWTACGVSWSKVSPAAYFASRAASVCAAIKHPLRWRVGSRGCCTDSRRGRNRGGQPGGGKIDHPGGAADAHLGDDHPVRREAPGGGGRQRGGVAADGPQVADEQHAGRAVPPGDVLRDARPEHRPDRVHPGVERPAHVQELRL